MKYRLLALAVVLLVGGGVVAITLTTERSVPVVTVAEGIKDISPSAPPQTDTPSDTSLATPTFRYEIANTNETRRRGLSGRESVPQNYGLLFVFPTADRHAFWMKDMVVPIDIVWLSDTGVILGIESWVDPATYPTLFRPPRPVRLVLETAAGEAAAQGWVVGTQLALPLRFE